MNSKLLAEIDINKSISSSNHRNNTLLCLFESLVLMQSTAHYAIYFCSNIAFRVMELILSMCSLIYAGVGT